MNFSVVPSNDEGVHPGQSWFQYIWCVEQFASNGTHRNSPRSMSSENHVLQCHTEPNSIFDNSNQGQRWNPQNEMQVPVRSLTLEKRMMQQRGRQRKRIVQHSRLSRFRGIIVSWRHQKIGSKAIAKRTPLAGQSCRTPLAIRNCPLSAPANSTRVMLSYYILPRKRQRKSGNPVFSSAEKIQA